MSYVIGGAIGIVCASIFSPLPVAIFCGVGIVCLMANNN